MIPADPDSDYRRSLAHAAERKAWARLVKAERAAACANRARALDSVPFARRVESCCAEIAAAEQAIRDLGVDVDKLLEE